MLSALNLIQTEVCPKTLSGIGPGELLPRRQGVLIIVTGGRESNQCLKISQSLYIRKEVSDQVNRRVSLIIL